MRTLDWRQLAATKNAPKGGWRFGIETPEGLLLLGFRLIGGVVYGPSSATGKGGFFRMVRMKRELARQVYDVVKAKVDVMDVEKPPKIEPFETAMVPLFITKAYYAALENVNQTVDLSEVM